MAMPNASFSITMRVLLPAEDRRALGRLTTAIGDAGGAVTAVDFVDTAGPRLVVDVTVNVSGAEHAEHVTAVVGQLDGVEVHRVSDRTFLMHLGGKIEVRSRVPLKTRDDLSMAYTPGVARICQAIAQRPEDARSLTIKGNTVAIVTDGSAVLGLGDIGPAAALPVMEGKAVLFKQFGGVDAWPVCLDTKDPDEIVRTVQMLAPVFGGVNLEDIAAPKCFEIEERLRETLPIPVFHDDQHGTAIVVLAALINTQRLLGKRFEDLTVAMSGAGAAGVAVAKLLLAEGVRDIVVSDSQGIVHQARSELTPAKRWLAEHTNRAGRRGTLAESLEGADVFIGVSGPNLLGPQDLARMNDDAVVFALANPDPEVDPDKAMDYAAVVATGRSDYPNQINNVLAFPGVFRGALDAGAQAITEDMKVAAAHAIAGVVADDELHATYIVPSVFNDRVAPAVADAVCRVAQGAAAAEE